MDGKSKAAFAFSSESNEWYTPRGLAALVREFFGGVIDLDPASCEYAQTIIRARRYYTTADDGLSQKWSGASLFLNPPYGKNERAKSRAGLFTEKLLDEYASRNFGEGIMLVNANVSAKWYQPLFAFPICFSRRRIKYERPPDAPPKTQPTKDNSLIYLGPRARQFAAHVDPVVGVTVTKYYGTIR